MKREFCLIDPSKDIVPEAGLGAFVEGYACNRNQFNTKYLWWILIPFAGWAVLVIYLIQWLYSVYGPKHNVFLYEQGVKWDDTVIRYSDIAGIRCSKTRNYQSTYGIRTYSRTDARLDVIDRNLNSVLSRKISYRNEDEKEDCYNKAISYAMYAMIDKWNNIALGRINRELKTKGCCTFYTLLKKSIEVVEVGKDYIRIGGTTARLPFKYRFEDGCLYIWSDTEEKTKYRNAIMAINVNDTCDNTLFLVVLKQIVGIG